jgi:Flp pilus assembly protein TadG
MVTAEIAVALPALLILVMASVTAVAVLTAQLRCFDAAREGARAAARGEPPAATRDIASRAAPRHAEVIVTAAGDRVSVAVTTTVRLLSVRGPSITVQGRAVTAAEPGVTGGGP